MEILSGAADRDRTARLTPKITTNAVAEMAALADAVHTDAAVLDYVAGLVEATRSDPRTALGASVRGALALVRCAKVWAASQGRGYVIPDDVKLLAEPVLAHRLIMETEAEFSGVTPAQVVASVLAATVPPTARI